MTAIEYIVIIILYIEKNINYNLLLLNNNKKNLNTEVYDPNIRISAGTNHGKVEKKSF